MLLVLIAGGAAAYFWPSDGTEQLLLAVSALNANRCSLTTTAVQRVSTGQHPDRCDQRSAEPRRPYVE